LHQILRIVLAAGEAVGDRVDERPMFAGNIFPGRYRTDICRVIPSNPATPASVAHEDRLTTENRVCSPA